jgi:hypothetical protein
VKYIVRLNIVSSPIVLDISGFPKGAEPLDFLESTGAGNSILGVPEELFEEMMTTDLSSLEEDFQDEEPSDGYFLLEQEETDFKYYRHAQDEKGNWRFLYSTVANCYITVEASGPSDLVQKTCGLANKFLEVFDETDTESPLGIYRLSGTVFNEDTTDYIPLTDEAFEGIWYRDQADFKRISDSDSWDFDNYILA